MTTEVQIKPSSHDVLVHQQDWDGKAKAWSPVATYLVEKGVIDTRYVHNERRIMIEEVGRDQIDLTFPKPDDEPAHEHLKTTAKKK